MIRCSSFSDRMPFITIAGSILPFQSGCLLDTRRQTNPEVEAKQHMLIRQTRMQLDKVLSLPAGILS
jgi:hypothetical protein